MPDGLLFRDDRHLSRTLAAYAAAVHDRNVDAFAALYADDVHVFDLWGAWELRGIDAWRAMAADWFGSLGDERVIVTAEAVESIEGADLVVGHALLTYTAMSAAGARLRSLDNRITLALARSGDAWRIVHEHTSAPVDHASGKAKFTRDPFGMG